MYEFKEPRQGTHYAAPRPTSKSKEAARPVADYPSPRASGNVFQEHTPTGQPNTSYAVVSGQPRPANHHNYNSAVVVSGNSVTSPRPKQLQQASSRRADSAVSVSNDMAAWKAAMANERQRRLVASQHRESQAQQKKPASRGAAISAVHHSARAAPSSSQGAAAAATRDASIVRAGSPYAHAAPPPGALTFHEYRSAVLATRPHAEVGPSHRSASQDSIARRQRSASTRDHVPGPIVIPHKRIDPMDVELRPARSVVRQFVAEDSMGYFSRKNPFGTLDSYADQVVQGSARRQHAIDASYARANSDASLRPYKAAREVWKEPPPAHMFDFPAPRSTVLRNQYLAKQRKQPVATDAMRAAINPYRRSVSYSNALLPPKDRRLVGAPSLHPTATDDTANVFALPTSISDRLISPHHNGNRQLRSRSYAAADGFTSRIGEDASFQYESDLDPVPWALGSPRQQQQHYERDGNHQQASNDYSTDTTANRADHFFPSSSSQPTNAFNASRSPPSRPNTSAVFDKRGGSGGEHALGVELSPPTPSVPTAHSPRDPLAAAQLADTSSDSDHPTTAAHHRQQDYDAPPPSVVRTAPQQRYHGSQPTPSTVMQQLAFQLPGMRNQRADLFQGHGTAPAAESPRPFHSAHDRNGGVVSMDSANNHTRFSLRQSAVHDKLEKDLLEHQQQHRTTSINHVANNGGGGDLSTSRTLLQQLATKRVPR